MEEIVSMLFVHKVSKSIVHKVSVMFRGWLEVSRASCLVSVTHISARVTVNGDPSVHQLFVCRIFHCIGSRNCQERS